MGTHMERIQAEYPEDWQQAVGNLTLYMIWYARTISLKTLRSVALRMAGSTELSVCDVCCTVDLTAPHALNGDCRNCDGGRKRPVSWYHSGLETYCERYERGMRSGFDQEEEDDQ